MRWRIYRYADGVVVLSFEPKITRGKTTLGRLRLVDAFLIHRLQAAVTSGPFVDLGCGVGGLTTIESRDALEDAGLNPVIWAIDADPSRLPHVDGILTATELEMDQIGVLRAMNVLRQYSVEEARQALADWMSKLSPQGILVEGTSDKHGELATFFCLGQTHELVLMTTFSRGFGPWMFRDYLPQIWRRTVKPGTELFEFFEDWATQFKAQSGDPDPQSRFFSSLENLEFDGLVAGRVNGGVFVILPMMQSRDGVLSLRRPGV